MRKIFLVVLDISIVTITFSQQPRALDQPMIAKSCSIRVEANAFIAKTFVELEYYNPRDIEIEGVEYFKLHPGQVINAFQLDIYGKYRDGSIEEKWKANNAYNSIVGKRIDPALLQMNGEDSYRLNIYPFSPKGTRRVTFTLVEVLKQKNDCIVYELPLEFFDSVTHINIDIEVNGRKLFPKVENGLLVGHVFNKNGNISSLFYKGTNVNSRKSLQFCLPQKEDDHHFICGKDNRFALRLNHNVPTNYNTSTEKISVFWDVSASGIGRNIHKEVAFLYNYILRNKITVVDLYTFNHSLYYKGKFQIRDRRLSELRNTLLSFKYAGSTDLGNLNFSKTTSNTVLVFSDADQTRGNKQVKQGTAQVHWILSSTTQNYMALKKITDWNGGSIINLLRHKPDSALIYSGRAENMLFSVTSNNKEVEVDQTLPLKGKNILLSGEGPAPIQLNFGNHMRVAKTYNFESSDTCVSSLAIMQMLANYNKVKQSGNWQELLVFGLENKIVTQNTAFIVLERIEDYIKYRIAPPKELEEECRQMNYVYSTPFRKKEIYESSKQEMLRHEIAALDIKAQWGNTNKTQPITNTTETESINPGISLESTVGNTASRNVSTPLVSREENTIAEVVVTSAFNTRRTARSVSSNVQTVSAEQLNIIRGSDVNNALAGKVAGIQVRSQSIAALGRESFIRLRGENSLTSGLGALYVVNGTVMPSPSEINPDDIEDLTVLQGPAATALFGPEGANGAIVINLKKAKRNYYFYNDNKAYRLVKMPDIHYIEELKNTDHSLLVERYLELREFYRKDASFYFDVAELFYEYKLKNDAFTILDEGIEMGRGGDAVLRGAAYILESWGEYKMAIELYKQTININGKNIQVMRDLGLCYFQDKQYQQALDTYNAALMCVPVRYRDSKQFVLNEMNALIALHKDELNISGINEALIRNYPSDLYISLGSNIPNNSMFKVFTPNKSKLSAQFHYNSGNIKDNYCNDNELFINRSDKGDYRIIESNHYYSYSSPMFTRIITFKNFQKPGQKIEIQHVQMDGQQGEVEIGIVKW